MSKKSDFQLITEFLDAAVSKSSTPKKKNN